MEFPITEVLVVLTIILLTKNRQIKKRFRLKEQTLRIQELKKIEIDEKRAREVILNVMQTAYSGFVKHPTTNIIKIPNPSIRASLIGKSGRNLKLIERLTKTDIIFDNKTDDVQISSFNPVRREIAIELLKILTSAQSVNASVIERQYDLAKKKSKEVIFTAGLEALEHLAIEEKSKVVIYNLGKLYLRHSYGQNVLSHSVETAKIMASLAREFNQDETLAKKAGLFHDIGKALDIDQTGSHVELGVKFAKSNRMPKEVIDAIASHHGDVEPETLTGALVAFADKVSAARPGVRKNTTEKLFVRISQIEAIANEFPDVKESFVIKGGKELRVIIKPKPKFDLNLIAKKIKAKIEADVKFPGVINIVLIKENRFTLEAVQKR